MVQHKDQLTIKRKGCEGRIVPQKERPDVIIIVYRVVSSASPKSPAVRGQVGPTAVSYSQPWCIIISNIDRSNYCPYMHADCSIRTLPYRRLLGEKERSRRPPLRPPNFGLSSSPAGSLENAKSLGVSDMDQMHRPGQCATSLTLSAACPRMLFHSSP